MNTDRLPMPQLATPRGDRPLRPVRGLVDSLMRRWSRVPPPSVHPGTAVKGDKAPDSIALTLLNSLREPLAFVVCSSGHWTLTGGNAALEKLLRRTASELAGLTLDQVLVPATGPVDPVRQALDRGTSAQLRGQAIDHRGALHWVTIRIEPVGPAGHTPSTAPTGQALVYLDPLEAEIDTLREATRRLRDSEERMRRQASDLDRIQREFDAFGAMLSHDLRMPLRAIDGCARQVSDDLGVGLPAPARDQLNRIRTASQQMNGIIDALRELSVVAGRNVQRRPVDLGDLAREVITEFRRTPADASSLPVHRPIRFSIASGLVVEADPLMMRLLLVNLLGNAIKFTGQRADPQIELGVSTSTGRRVFHVRDNGIGFDIVHGRRLFGMFQRLQEAEAFPGHGIGLAICRRVVRRFGGEIWASGLPGEGACFYFTVPS